MSINRKLSKLANLLDNATDNQYLVSDGSGELAFNDLSISLVDSDNNITNEFDPISAIRFDVDSGFDLTDLGAGAVKVGMNSTFKTWQVDGQEDLVAYGLDTIEFVAGNGVTIETDATTDPKQIIFNSTGGLSSTDDLTEGVSNLYFTDVRARNAVTGFDLDMNGNRVLFANVYPTVADLPDANTYHGMFAHVHAEGKGYFSHSGSWHTLIDESSSTTTDLTEGTNLYYTENRVASYLSSGSAGNIVTSGYLAGPETFTIDPAAVGDNTGTVVIAGNLQVDGTTTTINSTTVEIDDLNLILGSGSTNAAASNGGGIILDLGTDGSATFTYDSATNHFVSNLAITADIDGTVSSLSNFDTDSLNEGTTNLYYTDVRADARITLQTGANLDLSAKSTTDLAEGTNLYYTDARVRTEIEGADLDLGTNKILYSNVYATVGDLPVASSYHGMFAHVHATGKGYFAHAGNWVELANVSEIPTSTTDLAEGTNLYYTDARADARIAAASIGDLSDIDLSTPPAQGQVLSWNSTAGTFVPSTASGGGASIAYQTSAPTNPAVGEVWIDDVSLDFFVYTSSNAWVQVNQSNVPSLLDELSDVDTTTVAPSNNDVLQWDGTNFVPTALPDETVTTLTADSVNQKLVYTDEAGTVNDIDLSWAVDDTNLARITSGTLDNVSGVATFTRDDASTFTVDFSVLFDDTNNYVDSLSFDIATGVLTAGRTGELADLTVDLDGRYLTDIVQDTTPQLGGDLDANNNNITNISADGYSLPTADGTDRQVIMTDGSGNLSFEDLDTIHTAAKNETGSTIIKGMPVYQVGTFGNGMVVAPADASDPAKMPAVGVLEQDLNNGAEGFVIHLGQIQGVDTSAFSEGDVIYVAVGGGYTNVPPTGEGNLLQNLGRVTKVHASNGSGVIMGAGRTNAVPNLNDGNIFIGNASNQATTASFATTLTSELNNNSIDAMSDVDTTSVAPVSGDALVWDGANFVPQAPFSQADFDTAFALKSIDALADVDTSTSAPTLGDALVWDGSDFVPQAPFSQSDFNNAFSQKTTDNLAEGTTNLYYADSKVDTHLASGNVLDITVRDIAARNINLSGDLNVMGTTTTVNQTTLTVSDSKIFLADGNNADVIDAGIIFNYNDGANKTAGIFRDASDGIFNVYDSYTPAVGTTLDTAHSSYALAKIKADEFVGNINWDNITNKDDVSFTSVEVVDLTVTGTQTVNNTTTVSTENPFIILNDNPDLDIDTGFVGKYDQAGVDYVSGLFRDASDSGVFKFFEGSTQSFADTSTVDVNATGFALASVQASEFIGAVDWTNITNAPNIPTFINDLNDVDISTVTPEEGNTLIWDSANNKFVPGEGGGSSSVEVSGTLPTDPSAGDLWIYEDTMDLYVYYTDADSSQWIHLNPYVEPPTVISDLTDVNTSGIADGQTLIWNNTAGEFEPGAAFSASDVDAFLTSGNASGLITTGDVTVGGNLIVQGASTTLSAENLAIADNMLYLNQGIQADVTNIVGDGTEIVYTADNNYVVGMSVTVLGVTPSSLNAYGATITATDATSFTIAGSSTDTYVSDGTARAKANTNPDLGWAAGYNDGTYHHAGFFRDASDGRFKVFHEYDPEPDEAVFIDTADPSFTLADLQANNIYGTVIGTVSDLSNHTLDSLGDVDFSTPPGDGQTLIWDAASSKFIPGEGGGSVNIGATAPSEPDVGDLWVDESNLDLYVYYQDTNGNFWAQVNQSSVPTLLEDLSNVDLSTPPADNQALVWNQASSSWVAGNSGVAYGASAPSSPAVGDLWVDNDTLDTFIYTGTEWAQVNRDGVPTSIDDLNDVDTSTSAPTSGDALVWDGTNFVPQAPFSQADFDSAFTAKSTDDLSEGTTNLYYTDARVESAFDTRLATKTTTDLTEGDNLYYTDARVTEAVVADTAATVTVVDSKYAIDGEIQTTLSVEPGRTYRFDQSDDTNSSHPLKFSITPDGTHNSGVEYTTGVTSVGTAGDAGAYVEIKITNSTPPLYYYCLNHGNMGSKIAVGNPFNTDELAEGSGNLYYTDARVDAHLSGTSGVTYSNGLISIGQPVAASDNVIFNNITATGYLAGPETFTIDPAAVGDNTGTVVIAGNLQVDGTTTTINSTTLEVDDKNIVLGSGAVDASAANGGGITLDLGTGGSATITYDSTADTWTSNKNFSIDVEGTVSDLSNHDTDSLTEGAANLYYTDTRVTTLLGTTSIDALSDVDTTSVAPDDGNALIWNNTTGNWEAGKISSVEFSSTPPTSAETGELWVDDVTLNTFIYTGTVWAQINRDGVPTSIGDLSDVDTSTLAPTADQTIAWDAVNSKFVPVNGFDAKLATKTTDDLAEGANLYYTDARADARIAVTNVTDLADVNITTTPTEGQTLTWNETQGKWILGSGGGGGGASVTVSSTSPESPASGDMWLDDSTLTMYIYYVDSDSSQWIAVGGQGGAGAGTLGALGDVDLSAPPAAGQVLVYNGTAWVASSEVSTGGGGGGGNALFGYLNL